MSGVILNRATGGKPAAKSTLLQKACAQIKHHSQMIERILNVFDHTIKRDHRQDEQIADLSARLSLLETAVDSENPEAAAAVRAAIIMQRSDEVRRASEERTARMMAAAATRPPMGGAGQ